MNYEILTAIVAVLVLPFGIIFSKKIARRQMQQLHGKKDLISKKLLEIGQAQYSRNIVIVSSIILFGALIRILLLL